MKLLDEFFSLKGPLAKAFKGFEERPGQHEMARQIYGAYENDEIALIEAGTGTGKSVAYLIPAILWSIQHKEKTVISTYTIALQEQLISKDIPMLLKALDIELKAVIVKGMSNYLCLRKLDELEEEIPLLQLWSERTKEGSYSDITFPVASSTWEKVSADSYSCSHVHCPHYRDCFFFKARRKADEAQLLVVNHHLLFADLTADESILPEYKRIVIDEAHHLEDVALDSLSKRYDRLHLVRLLGRLYSELHPERSRLIQIRQNVTDKDLIFCLEVELPAAKRNLIVKIEQAFTAIEAFCRIQFKEQKWRLRESQFKILQKEVAPLFSDLAFSLKHFAQALLGLKVEIEKSMPMLAVEIQSLAQKLEEQGLGLEDFFSIDEESQRVRWVEATATNIILVDAKVNVSNYLREELFDALSTVSLCSATLSCGGNFTHLRQRYGIEENTNVTEKIYDSPFDYPNHALFGVFTDLPDPSEPSFTYEASDRILEAIEVSQGGAFVLFTSYEMLRTSYQYIAAKNPDFPLLKQGDASRPLLIEKFKSQKNSVLFGTDSFWEGVDIPGSDLRLVIIVKLPFRVPTDPLMQAVSEALEKDGKNAFMDYQVPQAVMKFKQGFGRLIRTKKDKGCILSLDKRIHTKSYGKLFLQSLPNCRTIIGEKNDIFPAMRSLVE